MILVDTSVWIDHLRRGDAILTDLLQTGQVLVHPFVIGELALGSLKNRSHILGALSNLKQPTLPSHTEVMLFIEHNRLHGKGIGYVDAHLLAAVKLTQAARLWTGDKRLQAIASGLELVWNH